MVTPYNQVAPLCIVLWKWFSCNVSLCLGSQCSGNSFLLCLLKFKLIVLWKWSSDQDEATPSVPNSKTTEEMNEPTTRLINCSSAEVSDYVEPSHISILLIYFDLHALSRDIKPIYPRRQTKVSSKMIKFE